MASVYGYEMCLQSIKVRGEGGGEAREGGEGKGTATAFKGHHPELPGHKGGIVFMLNFT